MHTTSESPSPTQLRELARLRNGYMVSHAMFVVAKLGIADHLIDGPEGSDELARSTGTHAATLDRVLRFLSSVGIFTEIAPRRFALTSLGSGLRSDIPGSIQPMTVLVSHESIQQAWGQLLHTVQTGDISFDHVQGMGFFDYIGEHPDVAALFHQAMTGAAVSSSSETAVATVYDFSSMHRIVDVGGGEGRLLASILHAYPTLRGILFDRPEVVANAPEVLAAAGVAERCEIVGGDFFAAIPAGGDGYLLQQIIHDWDEPRAVAILRQCRRAMSASSTLLVVEVAIPKDAGHASPVLETDMQMMVLAGGIQRTDAGYRALFAETGFRLTTIVPLGDASGYSIFEGVPI